MIEQFKGEVGPAPEKLEDQKYKEFQATMDEEERIMKEIDNVLATTPNREEAEKIVLETLAPQMDEAIRKSKQALDNWLNEMRKDN
ncbi:MAG: hypothetical protein NT136_02940 [Candidatus Moranbacteria bacterium]|nr:hypothetical protein [Candidatus Moranbacteria bacterium]